MNLLFYDDSPVFGGHEVMALLGLEAVLREGTAHVYFLASSANRKLIDQLEKLAADWPRLTLHALPYCSSKVEALRNTLQRSRISSLAQRFMEIQPDLVIAIQGNIEHSSLSLLAARRCGIRCTSYIPVPHSNAEMGARLGALRDLSCRHLFNAPHSFITITDEMGKMLKKRGTTVPIYIVYNGVDIDRFRAGDSRAARETLGLPQDVPLIGMIGRLECRQKQQHLLIKALASDPELTHQCHLVFAGEGPDREALEKLVIAHRLKASFFPWSDPALLYHALDAVVIPSRYEGLPLVMLEAISSNTAVIASDRDGMKDLLPTHWRFRPNDFASLASTLKGFLLAGKPEPSANLIARVRDSMSLKSFGKAFASTVFMLAR